MTSIAVTKRPVQVGIALLIVVAAMLWWARPAQAAGVVGNGTPGSCTGNALLNAAQGGGAVTFNCGPGVTTIDSSTIVVTNTMTIVASDNIILNGKDLNQLFLVLSTGKLTLRDITLTNGQSGDGGCIYIDADATNSGRVALQSVAVTNCRADGVNDGGAILNRGILSISDSILSGNVATRHGGAIFTALESQTTIVRTTFTNNRAEHPVTTLANGGAIFVLDGAVTVRQSLFHNNQAENGGGGIYNTLGNVTIVNSTLAGNLAQNGGGLFADGGSDTTLDYVTIAANKADTGGGLWRFNLGAVVTMTTSIVAGNFMSDGSTDGLDCDGPAVISGGYNVISDGTCVTGSVSSDQRNTNPLLGPLQDNGGPTFSRYPLPASPVIDAGPGSGCPALDQRGVRRPKGSACDVGAVEAGADVYLPIARE